MPPRGDVNAVVLHLGDIVLGVNDSGAASPRGVIMPPAGDTTRAMTLWPGASFDTEATGGAG